MSKGSKRVPTVLTEPKPKPRKAVTTRKPPPKPAKTVMTPSTY